MTWFARDYTRPIAEGGTRMWFNVLNLVLMAIVIYGLFEFFQPKKAEDKTPPASPSDAAQEKKKRSKSRWISGTIVVVSIALACYIYSRTPDQIEFMPSIFQQFNPFFVVALTPLSIALFGYLNRKKKEPSTPCKIGIGMVVAALGFLILAVVSLQLKNSTDLKEFGGVSQTLVSPNWLISTYLVLTFAELFLSPMGISFVSKVAPPKFKGLMMGGWFAATAVGNYLTFIPASLWESGVPLWAVWGVLIALCLVSAFFIFAIMKRLENATK